jgi:nicotinamidase-related amidase
VSVDANAVTASRKRVRTALLVIDVQQGLFKRSAPIYQAEQLLHNINVLVDRAHRSGAQVVYIQHANETLLREGSDDWQLHPQMQPTAGDLRIRKRHGSAFQDTELGQELTVRGVRRLVVTGLVTHGCVKATCLDAKRLGYEVVLASDGHSNYSKQATKMIEKWHRKLADASVTLQATQEIEFHSEGAE